jgi:hypothetical protein
VGRKNTHYIAAVVKIMAVNVTEGAVARIGVGRLGFALVGLTSLSSGNRLERNRLWPKSFNADLWLAGLQSAWAGPCESCWP